MVQQTSEVTWIKDFTGTHIDNSTTLELRSVPADMGPPETAEQLPIYASNTDRVEAFEASYSDREDGGLSTYLHQIGEIPRLTQEEELGIFIKIDKYRRRIDECYQDVATELPDVDLENPPSPSILERRITAESFPPSTEEYLLDLVQHIKFMQAEICTAKNCVVEANLRLAVCIAKKYRERGLDLLDLIQEANIGLIRAIDHFDWQRGVKLGAYASWWIQQAVGCGIANHGRTIRLPAYLLDAIRKVSRVEAHFHQKENYEPNREEIATATGFTVGKILQLDQVAADTTSLDACISQETGGEIGDFVACDYTPDPLTDITQQSLAGEVKAALATLPLREKRIVCLRYGLEDGEEHSLQEIGTMLNLSRERIRQLEGRALDRLRHPTRSEGLQDFLVV